MIFPSRCRACGDYFRLPPPRGGHDDVAPAFGRIMRATLCPVCIAGFSPADSPLCPHCGLVFKSREGDDHLCGGCITAPKPYTRARAAGIYEGSLKALIQRLKYARKMELALPLNRLLFTTFQRYWHPRDIDLVLPVPLHPRRMRQRGFNQAWLLIRDWPRRCRRAYGTGNSMVFNRRILRRSRSTAPQTGLDRRGRQTNIKNAFAVSDPAPLTGKRILLVDDVYTTGATAAECSRVLLAAGAGRVEILTVARTV